MRYGKGILRGISTFMVFLALSAVTIALATLTRDVFWPEATGTDVRSNGALTVDVSHAPDGYVMVRGASSDRRLKLRMVKGETVYTYDLNGVGAYEVIPLQLGSGSYTCTLYENVKGNSYAQAGQVKLSVELEEEYAAFLWPNQYVDYDEETTAVALSNELCAGLTTDREKFEAIRGYIAGNYVYDFVKALTVTGGTLPDIEYCMEQRMGICQDLSAMAACMLRVQGIPTKLIIGYADNNYHAWTRVLIDGEEILYDPTVELDAMAGISRYTAERCY